MIESILPTTASRTPPGHAWRRAVQAAGVWLLLACSGSSLAFSPQIEADRYWARAQSHVAEKNYTAAVLAMDEIITLQRSHNIKPLRGFYYHYASILNLAGAPQRAHDAVTHYLNTIGRKGDYYHEALRLSQRTVDSLLLDQAATATAPEIKALLDGGADVHITDEHGQTPLHRAALHNGNGEVTRMLLAANAEVNAKNAFGWAPLHRAVRHNPNPQVSIALVNAGADVNEKNADGWAPLHLAARYNDAPEVTRALLEHGADVHGINRYYWTPLHLATKYNGEPEVIKALLAGGANVYAKNRFGWSSLITLGLNQKLSGREKQWIRYWMRNPKAL